MGKKNMDEPSPSVSLTETSNSYPTPRQRRILWNALTAVAALSLLVVAALTFYGFITFLSWSYPILLPIGLAVIVALVLDPIVSFLQKRGLKRETATLTVCLLAVNRFHHLLGPISCHRSSARRAIFSSPCPPCSAMASPSWTIASTARLRLFRSNSPPRPFPPTPTVSPATNQLTLVEPSANAPPAETTLLPPPGSNEPNLIMNRAARKFRPG